MSPADLAQTAYSQGMYALGLTDHRLLTGSVEFVAACKQVGIQPILGLEIDLEQGPLQLLATSIEGWSNLCRLSSSLMLTVIPEAICSLGILDTYAKELIALSNIHIEELKPIFQDRLYVSLQDPSDANRLSALAHKLKLPTVATHPVYFLSPDQARLQKTLTAIRLNQQLKDVPSTALAPVDAYFMSGKDIGVRFRDFPEALAAPAEIAVRVFCNRAWSGERK